MAASAIYRGGLAARVPQPVAVLGAGGPPPVPPANPATARRPLSAMSAMSLSSSASRILVHFRTSYFTEARPGHAQGPARCAAAAGRCNATPRPAPHACLPPHARLLQWGQHVAVCGEGPLFGNWDVKK